MMSFQQLSPQANSGHQQRTAHPPNALAPGLVSSPQSTFYVRIQSLRTIGQRISGPSNFCQHFAEVGTITYNWEPITTAEVHELAALRIPVQVNPGAVAPGMPLPIGNGPNQRTQPGTPQPRQIPVDGTRMAVPRGPAFFHAGPQGRAPQPQASMMEPASYKGAPYDGSGMPGYSGPRR